MPPKTNPSRAIVLETADWSSARRMLFNRYSIERDSGFVVVHFGYVSGTLGPIDVYSIALSGDDLVRTSRENLDYLGKLGELSVPGPSQWSPPSGHRKIDLANHIALGRSGGVAEIVFGNFLVNDIIRVTRDLSNQANTSKNSAPAIPLVMTAVLRSDVELQKHLIRSIYEQNNA